MRSLLLAAAWLWVAVPLGWGVFQSVQKSLPLFEGPTTSQVKTLAVKPLIDTEQGMRITARSFSSTHQYVSAGCVGRP
jgi:hypothetical protein